jgi:hypothetical protein
MVPRPPRKQIWDAVGNEEDASKRRHYRVELKE